MSLEYLTDNIVQLCEECNVWSSTINIPHGNGDILDISAACGSQACTPKGAAMYPEECPNGLHGSYYTFDPSVYGEHSWPDLKSMLMTPGCVSGCKLVLRHSKGHTHFRKATHYLRCSRAIVSNDKSKSVYHGDNVGKSDVKTERMKRTKRCDQRLKGTRAMLSKKKTHDIMKRKSDDNNHPLQKPDHRRTVTGRAVDVSQRCKMTMIVFQSNDNRWHLHKSSQLEHSFHAELDDKAKALGEKDLEPSDIRLVRSHLSWYSFQPRWYNFIITNCYTTLSLLQNGR